jgi:hypothetical protein
VERKAYLRYRARPEIFVAQGVRQDGRLIPVQSVLRPPLGEEEQGGPLQLAKFPTGKIDWTAGERVVNSALRERSREAQSSPFASWS